MTTSHLIKKALASALGVALYVGVFAWLVNNVSRWFPAPRQSWVGSALFLMLFIVSACVTGSLVLLRPVLLYVEGHKKESVLLFVYTVACLAVVAVLAAGWLVIPFR